MSIRAPSHYPPSTSSYQHATSMHATSRYPSGWTQETGRQQTSRKRNESHVGRRVARDQSHHHGEHPYTGNDAAIARSLQDHFDRADEYLAMMQAKAASLQQQRRDKDRLGHTEGSGSSSEGQASGSRASGSSTPEAQTFLPPQIDQAHPLLIYRHLFTGERKCSQCDETIPFLWHNRRSTLESRKGVSLESLLHITCPSCSLTQCRGCLRPSKCAHNCSGGPKCPLPTCCSDVRAIAIFETLVDYDKAFATGVRDLHHDSHFPLWTVPKEEREGYLDLATSRVDRSLTKSFNNVLLPVLAKLVEWLSGDLHPSIPWLIATSHLLEAFRSFMTIPTATMWLEANDVYVVILDFLKLLARRRRLHDLVVAPVPDIEMSCTLQYTMWPASYIGEASASQPSLSKPLYEYIASNSRYSQMEKFALHSHNPVFEQRADVLWRSLIYINLLKASGYDSD